MENKSRVANVNVGDYLSETQYYRVTSKQSSKINVENERGFSFGVSNNIVEEGMYSANQFTEEKKVSRTELINIFSKVGDTVFTVNFNKQPKEKDISNALIKINGGKFASNAEIRRLVKEAYQGEERTLTGYLLSTETGFGRSSVIDLEAERGSNPEWDGRQRQVDHRTLNWLIHKNVKYIVKS